MGEAAAAPSFDGFSAETFSWFAGLQADNSKGWFTAHRDTYERAVRGALEAMLEELTRELGGDVKLFRQNRDVRFSADRSPYKTTTYGLIVDRPAGLPALYAQVSAGGLFAGSGYHVMAPDQLARFREAVADGVAGPQLEHVTATAQAQGVETFGEALKTAPRGYPRDHPRAGLLRHRSLVAGSRLEPGDDGIARDAALTHARATWASCAPINAWLDEHVGASEIPVDSGLGRRGRSR
jgi:uncharacterized protein (TIGR02453 family)